MEERNIKLTLEKAREFYNKGGEFRDLALSAFTEKELNKAELPTTWEEYCASSYKNTTYFDVDFCWTCSTLLRCHGVSKSFIAFVKLYLLRECYRQGWKPDLTDFTSDYYIELNEKLEVKCTNNKKQFLLFPSYVIAKEFLYNFKDLILEAEVFTGNL